MSQQPSSYSSPFLLSDDQIRELGVADHQIEQYRRKHYQNCFGIESWCTAELEPFTFKTRSVDLSYQEALALISLFKVNAKTYEKTTSLTSEEVVLLENVEKRIDECLAAHTEFNDGAFVKLNTRSPKDVPWKCHNDESYQNQLNKEVERVSDRTPNNICVAFLKAMNKSMKINSGKSAMELLGRSQRIYEDLQKNTGFGEKLYESKIILREWNEEMIELPQFEFRCFVHEKKLNAISQYFCDFKFDDLIAQKEEILKKINEFFNGFCIERIPHPSFVVDFFVSPTKGVTIIEINPFHNGAGPVSNESFILSLIKIVSIQLEWCKQRNYHEWTSRV